MNLEQNFEKKLYNTLQLTRQKNLDFFNMYTLLQNFQVHHLRGIHTRQKKKRCPILETFARTRNVPQNSCRAHALYP